MDPTGLRITVPSGQSVLSADRSHVVGRGRDCDVVIADGRVSRRHVLLEPRGDAGWLAQDVSSNGIWVDGARTGSVALTDGEVRVHLGAANGPTVVLAPVSPTPRRPPAAPDDPDVGALATVLAGQGGRIDPSPVPAAAGSAQVPARRHAGHSPVASWLRALPTFVWLAAVGFTLGALLALS
ncbi:MULTISPECIES: FHA domain-containing protein [unclassified Frankia]